MEDVKKFIAEMQEKGLNDEIIFKNLKSQGWDEDLISQAFLPEGAVIPKPEIQAKAANIDQAKITPKPPAKPVQTSDSDYLSGAESAMHSIFLWVFSLAFIVGVFTLVSNAMYGGYNYTHSEAVDKTTISVLTSWVITGLAYWIFYFKFAKRLTPKLKLHSGWSTATLILGGLTLIGSLIGLIANLIWDYDLQTLIKLTSVIIFSGVVVYNYSQINFAKKNWSARARFIKQLYPVLIGLLIAGLLIFVWQGYASLKADTNTKNKMAEISGKIVDYTEEHDRIPDSLADISEDGSEISYRVIKHAT